MSDPIDLMTSKQSVLHIDPYNLKTGLFGMKTLLVEDLAIKLQHGCISEMTSYEVSLLFQSGLRCKFLQPGADNWQTGTLRMTIEFHPDEPAPAEQSSPLDDIRQELSP